MADQRPPSPSERTDPRADAAAGNGHAAPDALPPRAPPPHAPGGDAGADAGPANARPEAPASAGAPDARAADARAADANGAGAGEAQRRPFAFDPLAPYKGAFRRFFTVYRHVLGLLLGGIVAYVRALPPGERKGFSHLWARTAAFAVRPFVKRSLRDLSFARQLRRRVGILGPTFVKLGQIMALREDLLPAEITTELENLLDRLPQIPFAQVEAILERDLGRPADQLFRAVQKEPLGSASLAQAHLAETTEGEQVVFKVIKPGIREVITSDLKLLEAVGVLLQWLLPRYQPRQIIDEFAAYTRREIDYRFEADNAEIFAANFRDAPGIVFPAIYRRLSSDDVLTMEFVDGLRPGSPEAQALTEAERARVVDLGAKAIIRMLYQDGFFHADLHAGNLRILPAAGPDEPVRIGFIDLGMVGRFGRKTKRRLLYYFYALVRGDAENATRYLVEMARVGPGGDVAGFERAVTDLARRFRRHGGREISIAQLILKSLSLGGKHRIFFPVEMTLMVKALVTYEGVGRAMDPDLDVARVSHRHVQAIFRERFDPQALGRELLSNAPEMIDLAVRLPQLLATGAAILEEEMTRRSPRPHPLDGLRNSLLAGACIIGGVLAVVQGGPWFLWAPLFVASFWFYLFGK